MKEYCRQCTDNQIRNVLLAEAKRINNITDLRSEVRSTAVKFYQFAREECARRGFDPDEILREDGVKEPDLDD